MSLLESVNRRLEKAKGRLATQTISPSGVKARLECLAEIQRITEAAIDSILRAHPKLSAPTVRR